MAQIIFTMVVHRKRRRDQRYRRWRGSGASQSCGAERHFCASVVRFMRTAVAKGNVESTYVDCRPERRRSARARCVDVNHKTDLLPQCSTNTSRLFIFREERAARNNQNQSLFNSTTGDAEASASSAFPKEKSGAFAPPLSTISDYVMQSLMVFIVKSSGLMELQI